MNTADQTPPKDFYSEKFDFLEIQEIVSQPMLSQKLSTEDVDSVTLYDKSLFGRVVAKAARIKKYKDKIRSLNSMGLWEIVEYN